jgi:ABC-type branched-subunit amino acid transport system substrate-binding protein
MKRSRFQRLATVGALFTMIGGGLGLTAGSSVPAGANGTRAPITIAMISSLTGEAASQFSDSPLGFRARIALQNSMGGIDGHKLVGLVIDDQTSPSADPTAVQEAISKGVAGIVSVSPLFFTGAKYAQQAGLPVTGGTFDGPEWGEKPYTNMFAADTGSVDPKYPVSTLFGTFFKKYGGPTSVIGSYGYGISPSSARSAVGTAKSAERNGLKVGVLDTSVPFGSVAFGPAALTAKSKGVNTLYGAMDDDSNFALLTVMKQAGMKMKTVIFPTGYEPSVVHAPAWNDLVGTYFLSGFRPYSAPDAETRQLAGALQKYEHRPPSDFATFNIYEAWLGTDLMIEGLELAGKNRTNAHVIKALHGITSYNGDGLLPNPINFTTAFGHDLPKACEWVLRAKPSGFALTSATPLCGRDIKGTSTASVGS